MRGDVYRRERAVKEKMLTTTARGGGRQPDTTAHVGGRQQALGEEVFICDLDGEISQVSPWRCPIPWRHVRDGENLI
jgi:hypothetical protein